MAFFTKKESKFWSHFYNQLTYVIDRKNRSDSNRLDINPFQSFGDQELALLKSLRNTLFFNRAKQRFTTSYTILDNRTHIFYQQEFKKIIIELINSILCIT